MGTPKFVGVSSGVLCLANAGISLQPLQFSVRAATSGAVLMLLTVNQALVYYRTGIATGWYQNISTVVGFLAVPVIRHLAGPVFMCSALADQLEGIGQQEDAARAWPLR